MTCLLLLVAVLESASPSPEPAPTPSPDVYAFDGAISAYSARSWAPNNVGALDESGGSDLRDRSDLSNAWISVTKKSGTVQGSATIGAYAFPSVGNALNPTTQPSSNTFLFGVVPIAYASYVPNAHVALSLGKLPTLLGQESAFTTQNANVERGLAFNVEPTVSRGLRLSYVQRAFSTSVEINDGYYSGSYGRALEGEVGWAPSAATSLQFAFLLPGRNVTGNATSTIGNKREFDLMFTRQIGKLQLQPYVLLVESPASTALGYTSRERALFFSAIASYRWSSSFSLGGRFEYVRNASTTADASANADLVGYGPGSAARTFTLTPTYRSQRFFARFEMSYVHVDHLRPGLGFGSGGRSAQQSRALAETGVQW